MFKKVPHTYVIVFSIILMAAALTWMLPGGKYVDKEIMENGVTTTQKVFEHQEAVPQTWQIFTAFFKGFVKASPIIVFILMIGGAFWIMNASKAIDVGILAFIRRTHRLEDIPLIRRLGVDNIIMILIMLMFSIFGAVFGMSEETIAFIVILVPLAISMGYDSITGVAMVFVAAGLGFAGAVLNPFTIGIAQGLAELPLFSGFEYRLVCWAIINLVGISYIVWYAHRIKKNPTKSPVYEEDAYWRNREVDEEETMKYHTPPSGWICYGLVLLILGAFAYFFPETTIRIGDEAAPKFSATFPAIPIITGIYALTGFLSLRKSIHFYILNLLGYTIVFLIVGVMGYGWYVKEIAALFFGMGLASGMAMGYDSNKITNLFLEGARDIMSAALVVGLAGGILVILEDGNIIDSILNSLASTMSGLGKMASVSIMYVIQTIINVVIPSGSAKAALTMPIMAPFSDLIGVSRQATVMAYQFGDGFTNLLTPTSGVLIGVLGVAKIPYSKWVKWITPLITILILLGLLLLIPTVTMDLSGF